MIAHSIWWTFYAGAVATVARRCGRDWRNPDDDHRVTLAVAAVFAVLLAGVGVLIAVLT